MKVGGGLGDLRESVYERIIFCQGSHFLAKKMATMDNLKQWVATVAEVGGGLGDVRESVSERIKFWSR